MKPSRYLTFLCASVMVAFTGSVHAQPTQTAQGAQDFLRAFFENRSTGGRWLATTGLVPLDDGSPATLLIGVTAMDTIDGAGKSNPCVTTIRGLDFAKIVLESNGAFYNRGETPLPMFPGVFTTPQHLDWGKAAIVRGIGTNSTSTSHYVSATFRMNGQSGPNAAFRLSTFEVDMADRIEYAMKFLKMSCDASAETGF